MPTYDIHIPVLALLEQSSEKPFGFGYATAVGVRGVQKLANQYLKRLLTEKGSDPVNKNYGTGLASLLGTNTEDSTLARQSVTLAVEDCNAQMRGVKNFSVLPTDEQFHSAVITDFFQTPTEYFVQILLRNQANQTIAVVVPPNIFRR